MTGTTSIEWTQGDDGTPGRTWNPVTGCTKVSPGCDHCYAEGIARRFAGSKSFPNGFDVTLRPERLDDPLRWRKPARVFVNSMSDLFHDAVPDEFVAQVFAMMAATPHHTYQCLTKRHGRMRSLLRSDVFQAHLVDARHQLWLDTSYEITERWPLPNVHLGVSAENQRWANIRIPALRETPAAVRFVSAEPLLGSLNIASEWADLDWVIIGGESGPGARPMDLTWARNLVNDCRALGIAPFVKQLGSAWASANGWGGKGSLPEQWPADLRVREFPTTVAA